MAPPPELSHLGRFPNNQQSAAGPLPEPPCSISIGCVLSCDASFLHVSVASALVSPLAHLQADAGGRCAGEGDTACPRSLPLQSHPGQADPRAPTMSGVLVVQATAAIAVSHAQS